MVTLSILIASTASREEMLGLLLKGLIPQCGREVEILMDMHETNSIGKKRNDLLARSTGEYIVYIDSDDHVSPDYVKLILAACITKPDCIGINGIITTNGQNEQKWFISKEYGRWYLRGNVYYRTPNHISPVRRELALKAGFPEVKFAEDFAYSQALLPYLKTETLIHQAIYHYDYRTDK